MSSMNRHSTDDSYGVPARPLEDPLEEWPWNEKAPASATL